MKKNNLPKEYIPYDTLKVCSNTLIGGVKIVAIGSIYPILIGKAETPNIWLQALVNPLKNEFITIVEKSISKHSLVSVFEEKKSIYVKISGKKILSARQTNNTSVEIYFIDLRPLGLDIHGNKNILNVGQSSFTSSTMLGGEALIGFGDEKL